MRSSNAYSTKEITALLSRFNILSEELLVVFKYTTMNSLFANIMILIAMLKLILLSPFEEIAKYFALSYLFINLA